MADRLVVVIGAGASKDCTSHHVLGGTRDVPPPLVRDLFRSNYAYILDQYPMAQFAAADIRRLDQDAISIEQFLRDEYATSNDALTRRKFMSVPLYLQHLLLEVSFRYTTQPDNYDLLVSNALKTDMNVLFVTLNYDLLLDRRLDVIWPLDRLDAYINAERGWSLIKLHGSVDWGHIVQDAAVDALHLHNPPAGLQYDSEVHLARGPLSQINESSLSSMRRRNIDGYGAVTLYPALSAPLGEEDEFSCPGDHVAFLKSQLEMAEGLHLLVVGYSGIDLEVLRLIRDSGTQIKTTCIVNHDEKAARTVLARLASQLDQNLGSTLLWESTFGGFVQVDGWDRYTKLLRQ